MSGATVFLRGLSFVRYLFCAPRAERPGAPFRFWAAVPARLAPALFGLACVLFASSALGAPAKRVYTGVYLHDVVKFDQKDGVFDVDLELWAKWLGDFDPDKLVIANAAAVERTEIAREADGAWHSARWRVKGTLRGEFPVQRFPFDHQTLAIVLELPRHEGRLAPDLAASGIRERFSITGWLYDPVFVPKVERALYRSDLGSIATEGKPTRVNRVAFELTLRRPFLMAATKLFLPLLVILLVALIALFIHPKWLDVRAGVGVTALLACFAFQFSVADTMPNVAYMTAADQLFLAAYAITAILLGVSIVSSYLHDKNLERSWRWLDTASLVVIPAFLAAIVAVTAHEPEPPPKPPAKPLGGVRPKSSRAVLRIGTNTLSSALGGLAGRAATWGTFRTELDGTRVPVLAEEVPSVSSHALSFLADGQLEVTWRLRENLRWSDGAPLTAQDLEFALNVSPDPWVASVRVTSPLELVVRYKDRVATALENINPLPRHALEQEFKKGGYARVREYRQKHALPSTGPYRVSEFVADDHAILEKNPNFIGNPPSIPRVEIRRYPDDAALVKAFEDGRIDLIVPNAIGPEAAEELAKRRPDAVEIRPSEVLVFLNPDLERPELSSLEVRRAILSAIDRESLRVRVFGDAARVADAPIPGTAPEGTEETPYDPALAKAAFATAGLVGKSLPVYYGSSAVDAAIAAALIQDLAKAGLTLEGKPLPRVGELYRKRKHGGLLLTTTTGERDASPEKYWSVPVVDGKFQRGERSPAYTDAIAELVDREERALYRERREQIRDRLFVEYSKRLPNLPLLFLADRLVADPELRGFSEGSGNNFGLSIERWFFEKKADARAPAPTLPAGGHTR